MRASDPPCKETTVDLADVHGHQQAKRALEIVAAGGHHLLMVGAPGSGKTMLARRLAGILPPLSSEEALDVTRIWSAAGLGEVSSGPRRDRPFRAPHHTASRSALVGGGPALRPGEVSLAHHGVLFLDELPEFSRDALEAMRQPMEEAKVVIARRCGTAIFPAACTVVGAMNPCPCGYLGHEKRRCVCTAASIERYQGRVSGPLLDRIDALVVVPPLRLTEIHESGVVESTEVVAGRVAAARAFAQERVARCGEARRPIEERMALTEGARTLLHHALANESLGGRGYVRVMRLARTIADLDGTSTVATHHVGEALALRLDYHRTGAM